ncbi:MAG: hypothetical protein ACRDH6_06325, partial [Actinomycetota bacterium]
LVITWTNAAGRPGGHLTFSTHNQQIVGNRIYLSNYHGGIYLLDARQAFRGRRVRPPEMGFVIPHGEETRPIVELPRDPMVRFFTSSAARPMIWDMAAYKGYVLAVDMFGGLYSFRFTEPGT